MGKKIVYQINYQIIFNTLKINAYELIKTRQNFYINQAMIWDKLSSNTLPYMSSSSNFLMRNLPGSILRRSVGMVVSVVLIVVLTISPNVRITLQCLTDVGNAENFSESDLVQF